MILEIEMMIEGRREGGEADHQIVGGEANLQLAEDEVEVSTKGIEADLQKGGVGADRQLKEIEADHRREGIEANHQQEGIGVEARSEEIAAEVPSGGIEAEVLPNGTAVGHQIGGIAGGRVRTDGRLMGLQEGKMIAGITNDLGHDHRKKMLPTKKMEHKILPTNFQILL